MVRGRGWLVVLTGFWVLLGLGLSVSNDSGYHELVGQGEVAGINVRGAAVAFTLIGSVALLLLVAAGPLARSFGASSPAPVVHAGAILSGLTIILFALLGLLYAENASAASCPFMGFGAERCAELRDSYQNLGWFLFTIASASIVLLLIIVIVAGLLRRSTPAVPGPPTASGPPTVPPEWTPPTQADVIHQLRELAELRDNGVLTEEEFLAQKQRLLGS